jgi:transcriptional regulator with XRE-family HTH domain
VASPAALRARPAWETDPSFLAEYERQYPYQQAADAILQLRADLGLTQQELASRAGTTQSVVARAESGRHSFQISLLNRVAAAGGARWRPTFEPIHEAGDGIIVLANVVRSSEPAYLMTPPADPGDNSFSELALTANCSG